MSAKKFLLSVPKHEKFPVLMRFSFGGALAYVFNIAVTTILTEIFRLHYLSSFIIAFTLTTIFNFTIAIKFIFRVENDIRKKLFLYVVSVIALYAINISLVKLLVETLHVHYILAITFITGLLFVAKFLFYDRYVFTDERPQNKRARAP